MSRWSPPTRRAFIAMIGAAAAAAVVHDKLKPANDPQPAVAQGTRGLAAPPRWIGHC